MRARWPECWFKSLLGTVCFLVAVRYTTASLNINTEAVKESVVFIYPAGPNGDVDPSKPDATGFFVSVPTTETPPKYYWLLVTARHVVDPQWAYCSIPNPGTLFLRLNRKDFDPKKDATGVDFVRVSLLAGNRPLYMVNSDDDFDVAVILITPGELDLNKFEVNTIHLSEFATPEETKSLSIGDDLLSAGLMPFYTGVNRNYPIFKFGKISDIPDETVPMSCKPKGPSRQLNEWLIAVNQFPGSSGSPVFSVPFGANGISLGPSRPFLVGLQSISYLGVDLAGMTPAQAIFDVIQSMNLPKADLYRGLAKKPQ